MVAAFGSVRYRHLVLFAAVPAAVGLVGAALSSLVFSTPDQLPPTRAASGAQERFPLAISPAPIVFEVLDAGESSRAALLVRNTQSIALTLERIEISCSCVGISPVPIEIGPGERKTLNVTFDSSGDADFEDGLTVDISGYLPDGKIAFRTQAKVQTLQ
jgi:hypothetical protein